MVFNVKNPARKSSIYSYRPPPRSVYSVKQNLSLFVANTTATNFTGNSEAYSSVVDCLSIWIWQHFAVKPVLRLSVEVRRLLGVTGVILTINNSISASFAYNDQNQRA